MLPSTSPFSFVTAVTTSPERTAPVPQRGAETVEDTTYLGRPFKRSAHSPDRDNHRSANHASVRRPSSNASVRNASSNMTLPHSSRSVPPNLGNQPPKGSP